MTFAEIEKRLVQWAFGYLIIFSLVAFATGGAELSAVAMEWGIFLSWVYGIAPLLGRKGLPMLKRRLSGYHFGPKVFFFIFAAVFALIEEALAVIWNDFTPPLFGQSVAPLLTASTNYFEVIVLHSVVVFLPLFLVWAYLLYYGKYSPREAYLYFGLTGVLAEYMFNPSVLALLAGGFWILIYGSMVYHPAQFVFGKGEGALHVTWKRLVVAVFLPLLASIPVAILIDILKGTS
jgi:hypothetical protein